jgi:hypothetical protein
MSGTDVSQAFYERDVAPLLDGIPHAAGRIGRGSDVLGLDDETSKDHDWGERVTVITEHDTPPLPEGVELYTHRHFVTSHLGCDPEDEIDWLLLTGQSVLEVIAASWRRIDQELPFIGRTSMRGDAHGATIITARLAQAVMHLTFLYERQWPPYSKWFGTAYGTHRAALDSETAICDALDALAGKPWRRMGLRTAYEAFRA